MGFTYGLAVVLFLFEGVIIQCEGAGDGGSIEWIQNAPFIEIEIDKPFLPNDLIELIISKTDYKTIQKTVQERIVPANEIVMRRILQDCIIAFMPEFDDETVEKYQLGDTFLIFGNYRKLHIFLDEFGDQIKKIGINLKESSNIPSEEIIQDIIKRYAKNLEELRITTDDDEEFWEYILDGENYTIFPEVKKFQLIGDSSENELKLNLIFPKLECLSLLGYVADVNFLADVKTLKELTLLTSSIQEHQLDHIFENNINITKISLLKPNRTETMQSIAKHLTKLKTLKVDWPGGNFLLRPNNTFSVKLPSVNHFHILCDKMVEVFGIGDLNLSFDMPHLKKLTFYVDQADDRIINFIQHFQELEILELSVNGYNAVEFIEKLKHIKEITTTFYGNQFESLKNMFENFDEESKLQTLKLVKFDESLYKTYEDIIKEINAHLRYPMKSTWTLSHGKQNGTGEKYLMFRREPCTYANLARNKWFPFENV